MGDHIPAGFRTVKSAFESWQEARWGDTHPQVLFYNPIKRDLPTVRARLDRIVDLERDEFISVFSRGELTAQYTESGQGLCEVAERTWSEQFYADSAFLHEEIPPLNGPWAKLNGRILIVNKEAFSGWLKDFCADPKRRAWVAGGTDKIAREELLDAALHAEIKADEAESLARRWNVVLFQRELPLSEYDPMKEEYWSLAMTLAWIMWRSSDLVRKQSEHFRRNSYEWARVDSAEGYEPRRWPHTNSTLLELEALDDQEENPDIPVLIPFSTAKKELWSKLTSGAFSGFAKEAPEGVPTIEWQSLVISTPESDDIDRLSAPPQKLDAKFSDIRFKVSDILKHWRSARPFETSYKFDFDPNIYTDDLVTVDNAIGWVATYLQRTAADGDDAGDIYLRAERMFFSAVDMAINGKSGAVSIQGRRMAASPSIMEDMHPGLWAVVNIGEFPGVTYWPLKNLLRSGNEEWGDLRVSTSFVRAKWSLSELTDHPLKPRQRRRTKREVARTAINKLYPDGVPDPSRLDNITLIKQVGDFCQRDSGVELKRDTIMRAAERQK